MTTIDQKEYLKKYLGKKSQKAKEKKKKKKSLQSKGFVVIEDSVNLETIPYGYVEDDCAPTIAEITYENEETKLNDEFQINKRKWKVVNKDEAVQEKLHKDIHSLPSIQRHGSSAATTLSQRRNNDSLPSPSLGNGHDLDMSPSRRKTYDSDVSSPLCKIHDADTSPPGHKVHSSNASPPRHNRHDSDTSPPRRKRYDPDTSSPRRKRHDSDTPPPRRKRHDSDTSPPRHTRHDSDTSPPRHRSHDSDTSPPRRKRYDSDTSPPRRKIRHDSDTSPPHRKRHDSNTSPPRCKKSDSDTSPHKLIRHDLEVPPPWRERRDSDVSQLLPKKNNSESSSNCYAHSRRQDSDIPLLQSRRRYPIMSPENRLQYDSDSSPPRRKNHDSDLSPSQRKRHESDSSPPPRKRHGSDSSPPRRKRLDSDLSPRRKEHDSHVSSIMRVSNARSLEGIKTGSNPVDEASLSSFSKKKGIEHMKSKSFKKLREKNSKELTEEEKALAQKMNEKYQKWNKGLAQMQKQKDDLEYTIHEMGKTFARSADDGDMNDRLKNVLRQDDPMLDYIMKKKAKEHTQPVKPSYKGSYPPNRFHIAPGYRWDGVDRSSGFEREWFTRQSSMNAAANESYKWSTEDM